MKRIAVSEPLLPREVRRALHAVGYVEPHFSDWKDWRRCDREFLLRHVRKEPTTRPVHIAALLGSVFHAGCAVPDDEVDATNPDWFFELMEEVRARPRDKGRDYAFKDGAILTRASAKALCARMIAIGIYGPDVTWGSILVDLRAAVLRGGWQVQATEFPLRYVDGRFDPIRFEGAIDLLLRHPKIPYLRAVDTKTTGFHDPLLATGSVKKVSTMSPQAVRFEPQNRHYGWLAHQMGLNVGSYGQAYPSNLVPYLKGGAGYKAGDLRGQAVVVLDGCNDYDDRARHAEDIREWLTAVASGVFPRRFPHGYGTELYCHTCAYKGGCLGDRGATESLWDSLRDDSNAYQD